MSLREDFRNYFCSTFIGVSSNGKLLPFKVEDVVDNSDFERNDYSDAHKAALRFVGYLYNPETGRSNEQRFNVTDERLVLETPAIGYFRDQRGRVRWVRYRASRNRLKGIHSQKLVNLNSPLSLATLYKLFNPEFEGLVNMHLFISPVTNVIYYKGVAVGKMIDGRANILSKWQHINSLLREYNVHVNDSIEFPTPTGAYGRVVSEPHPHFDSVAEELGIPANPFDRPVRNGTSTAHRLAPYPREDEVTASRRGQTTGAASRTTQPISAGEQDELDRQRGHRENGHPVPMHGESYQSFSVRMDEYFANHR